MSTPSAVLAIMSRISELSQMPAAVASIEDRFAVRLSAATVEAATTPATASTSNPNSTSTVASSAPTVTRAAGSMQTARIDRTGMSTTTQPTGTSATTAASGVWVDRVPNARGKALVPDIQAAAAKYGLDPAFLAAVFWTESSYTPNVVSPTGAIGLGQLMPETAAWLHVDPWDPVQNIDGSAKFYRYLLDRNNGSMELAIASYAAGPGAVARAGGVPDQFTANYITKLLGRRDYLNGVRATPP